MQRRIVRSLVLLMSLMAAVVLTPLHASAQTEVTITVGAEGTLLDPTLVRIPVEITCAPMDVASFDGSGELRQAVSKEGIATAIGVPDDPIVCDGTPHQNTFTFWADPSGAPLRKGEATVRISLTICDASFTCQTGSSAIQIVELRKA